MNQQRISEILRLVPLPDAFSANAKTGEELADLYRKAAFGRGSKGPHWGAWLLVVHELGTDATAAASGLSDGELAMITKWSRGHSHSAFPSLYRVHFSRQRSMDDYPIQDDTLFYLDLLLENGEAHRVVEFVQTHYPPPTGKECYWERSRLVIAFFQMNQSAFANREYLKLEKVLGPSDADLLALHALMLAEEGAMAKAENAARLAWDQGVSDDGLERRIAKLLGRPSDRTSVGMDQEIEKCALRDTLDAMAAMDEPLSPQERKRRLSSAFEKQLRQQ